MTPTELKAYAKGLRDGTGVIKDKAKHLERLLDAIENLEPEPPTAWVPYTPALPWYVGFPPFGTVTGVGSSVDVTWGHTEADDGNPGHLIGWS